MSLEYLCYGKEQGRAQGMMGTGHTDIEVSLMGLPLANQEQIEHQN